MKDHLIEPVRTGDEMGMDLAYIDNGSLRLDFKIFFQTVKVVLLGEGR
jgi:lipopolysaccharide/colanic/teichoic acid biosynthesis glycosyltransferase